MILVHYLFLSNPEIRIKLIFARLSRLKGNRGVTGASANTRMAAQRASWL